MPFPVPAHPRPAGRRAVLVTTSLLCGGALLWAPAGAADAHVRVRADTTTAGAYSALTFRVPNESDDASTTAVSVQLPQDTPFASVQTRPLPGWQVTTTTETLPAPVEVSGATLTRAVRSVTWTAADDDDAIRPDQYQEFALSVGPLPGAGTVLLPATQTYSDGEVVRWDQPTPASGEEPEHPAPALQVGPATPRPAAEVGVAPVAASGDTDTAARWLGGSALVLAVLAAALGGFAVTRTRARRS